MKQFILFVASLALLLGGVEQTRAGVLITSVAGQNATDSVSWGVLGPTFTDVASPFVISSGGGVSLTVSQPNNANFERRDQGNGWAGDFANGAQLLWDDENGPTVTLNFGSTGIAGGGAQIQSDDFGGFTARITALDGSGNTIESFTEAGNSNSNGDNSAIYIGVQDLSPDIHSIVFSLDSAQGGSPNDFAIGQFYFNGTTSTAVPEPASLTLLGIGIASMAGYGWRRRKQSVPA